MEAKEPGFIELYLWVLFMGGGPLPGRSFRTEPSLTFVGLLIVVV